MKGKEKSMIEIRNIIHRLRMGEGKRSIERVLGVHRTIIRQLYDLGVIHQWLDPDLPMPSDDEIAKVWKKETKTRSHPLDPYREQLQQWSQEQKSAVVMYQLLKEKCSCSDQSIRRYINKHFPKVVQPVMVRSTTAGAHLDLDFGDLGYFFDDEGIRTKVWLYSLRLRHSRKAYREIVLDQKSSTFLMGHVHAFEYFNGVPANSVMDNLKAAVIKPTADNDMINRSYQELAEHYGFIISPCNPYTPEHKGGVEGDVKYVKRNFLPWFLAKQKEMGIEKSRICDLAEALKKWEKEVANVRIIQGIGRSPNEIFADEEQNALRQLPKTRWELTSWCQCTVRRDWRIMYESAYYSVPHQYIGKKVDVKVTHSLVRIFFENQEISLHERATKKWEYKRKIEHAPPFQEAVLQSSREGLLLLAEEIGSFTYQLVKAILDHPSVDKLKPARLLLTLGTKYSKDRIEKACQRALSNKLFSYKSVKSILEKNLDSQPVKPPSNSEKIIPIKRYRFERDPIVYKSPKESFEEKLERRHPFSKYGNAMMGIYSSLLVDQILDEEAKHGKQH
jgi:hypothetical protein